MSIRFQMLAVSVIEGVLVITEFRLSNNLHVDSTNFGKKKNRISREDSAQNWLLHPLRESNFQLFILISLWISSKVTIFLMYRTITLWLLTASWIFLPYAFWSCMIHTLCPQKCWSPSGIGTSKISISPCGILWRLWVFSIFQSTVGSSSFFPLSHILF